MENASKALLMAGAILVAIIIIGFFMKEYGIVVSFQNTKAQEEEQNKIIEFNEQFTQYLGKYIYGTDVITNINKALNSEYEVKVKIFFEDIYTYKLYDIKNKEKVIEVESGKFLEFTDENNIYTKSFINSTTASDFKNRAFQCNNIEYDSTTGRVNSITFTEKKWSNLN